MKKNENSKLEVKENILVQENKSNKEKETISIVEWVFIILIPFAVAAFVSFVILIYVNVPTGSMETTIMPGDYIMGCRVTYLFENPQRGDIVIFKYPDDPSQNFIKRIVGLPGETLEVKEGVTYINGEALDEPYLKETPEKKNYGPYVVPGDCYFMMGDNRNNSSDSRYWKTTPFVNRKDILAKGLVDYWPLNKIHSLYK